MILVYWRENLLTWMAFLLGVIFPVFVTYSYVKKNENIKMVLVGNIMFFATNMFLIRCINSIGLVKKSGLMWHGYFKPFYTEQFFVIIFIILLIIELVCYRIVKHK